MPGISSSPAGNVAALVKAAEDLASSARALAVLAPTVTGQGGTTQPSEEARFLAGFDAVTADLRTVLALHAPLDAHFRNQHQSPAPLAAAGDQAAGVPGADAAPAEGGDARITLSEFFQYVGNGVIDAQKTLDRQSAAYVQAQGGGAAPSLPTVYRVPKVSAEIQFAIESTKSESLNILVASRDEEKRRSMQQKIAFDIVAMPPPPELLDGTADRAVIGKRLRAMTGSESDAARALAEQLPRAVVMRGVHAWLVAHRESPTLLVVARVPYAPDAIRLERIADDAQGTGMLALEWLRQNAGALAPDAGGNP